MPPKKVIKKTKPPVSSSTVKTEKDTVKQIVNVTVGGDMRPRAPVRARKTKTIKKKAVGGGGGGGARSSVAKQDKKGVGAGMGGGGDGLRLFNRPAQLSTQLYITPQPNVINEYNELLKNITSEIRNRLDNLPPLAPNSSPLTANIQTNELLARPIPRNPMIPIAQAFAVAQEASVEKAFADDPLTNENMFVGSSRLAEKLTQKLPVTNFDYNDMESYDSESNRNQEDLVSEAVSSKANEPTPSGTKYKEVSKVYDGYIKYLKDVNERYGINESPKARRDFNSQIAIKKEIRRIQDLVLSI